MRVMLILLCYHQIDARELTEGEGDENEVNTGEIIANDVPGCLYVRTGDSFQPELSTSSSSGVTNPRPACGPPVQYRKKLKSDFIKTGTELCSSRFPEATADPFGGGTAVARAPPVTPLFAGVSAQEKHRAYPRSPRATDWVR
ncbi:hypothetical protein TNCV_960981 [Trichonephila clavipes]|uniref:Secreted protein n=1 Tax=Trichonephila clavipes TaxID=2585209 RepID=A0A8X6S0V5_TRICX|nr:hypothetical protein TNCV_960981 [Trichonephila clavipes]